MKLKKLVKIERTFNVFIGTVMVPFVLVRVVLHLIDFPFNWVVDKLDIVRHDFGNMILRKSDEVKDGTIKNEMCIRTYTAIFAYKELNRKANLK